VPHNSSRTPYILRQWPEQIDTTTPENLERLRQFVNHCLSIDGAMTKALEAEADIYGKHGRANNEEDRSRD